MMWILKQTIIHLKMFLKKRFGLFKNSTFCKYGDYIAASEILENTTLDKESYRKED